MSDLSPNPANRRPTRWFLVACGGLLSAAVLTAGLTAHAKQAQKKDEPAKEAPKKDEPKARRAVPDNLFPDLDDVFKNFPPGFGEQQKDEFRKQMEEIRKQQQQALEDLARALQRANGRAVPGFPAAGRGKALRNSTLHEGRLGALVEMPSPTLIDQLDLPKEQGMVVQDVMAESAAARAGMKPHDILLELNGQVVPSKIEEFLKQLDGIKANTPVDAVVLRKGKKETLKGISLPEAPKVDPLLPRIGGRGNPLLPAVPAGGRGAPGAGGRNSAMSVTRTNDDVVARVRENGTTLTVTGKMEVGNLKIEEIKVQDGSGPKTYESVDKVPEPLRDQVKQLIAAVEKKNVGDR